MLWDAGGGVRRASSGLPGSSGVQRSRCSPFLSLSHAFHLLQQFITESAIPALGSTSHSGYTEGNQTRPLLPVLPTQGRYLWLRRERETLQKLSAEGECGMAFQAEGAARTRDWCAWQGVSSARLSLRHSRSQKTESAPSDPYNYRKIERLWYSCPSLLQKGKLRLSEKLSPSHSHRDLGWSRPCVLSCRPALWHPWKHLREGH